MTTPLSMIPNRCFKEVEGGALLATDYLTDVADMARHIRYICYPIRCQSPTSLKSLLSQVMKLALDTEEAPRGSFIGSAGIIALRDDLNNCHRLRSEQRHGEKQL